MEIVEEAKYRGQNCQVGQPLFSVQTRIRILERSSICPRQRVPHRAMTKIWQRYVIDRVIVRSINLLSICVLRSYGSSQWLYSGHSKTVPRETFLFKLFAYALPMLANITFRVSYLVPCYLTFASKVLIREVNVAIFGTIIGKYFSLRKRKAFHSLFLLFTFNSNLTPIS